METRAFQTLQLRVEGAVGAITLNRPERKNAINPAMANELLWALDDLASASEVHVIVLTGAGGAFCSGGDLGGMGHQADALPAKGDFADLLLRFTSLGKPVVARVNGPAMGGGLGLVAACDFAVAGEAAILGLPEIKRGLFPMQIMAVLQRVVPRRRLLELMLLGEKVSARQGLELGLVTHVVPDAELDAAVDDLARRLAAQSPTAVRLGLAAFHRQADMGLEAALPELRQRFLELLNTEDAREGLLAFMQKRPPVWTGR